MTLAVYNEINLNAAAALRELIRLGVIAPGVVDTRSIKEVSAYDYREFQQWHFFAGGGLWSVAARGAGWPDARPLGTASCPCQPFSQAGEQLGTDDPRHLWPDLYRIIRTARDAGFGPSVWMGEQVAGKAGYDWFHGVRADMAREAINARTVDIPACAVDAPHERNRLYWVAVGHSDAMRQPQRQGIVDDERRRIGNADEGCGYGSVAHTQCAGGQGSVQWVDGEWIVCHDGKARRAKSDIPMLVNGMAGRSHLWSLVGNSIVPVIAQEVIAAFLDAESAAAPAAVLTPPPY
jgi:DNA (cytosine-5)-methyltransferase 1